MENQITTTENSQLAQINVPNLSEIVAKSQNLDKMESMISLTAEYHELEKPGESFRGVFIGFQTMQVADKTTGEVKELNAARFLKDKRVLINAGAVLINELKRANVEVGTAIEVTYLRKEGNAKIYSLALLG